jgi:Uma2 family endonuclease
MAALPDPPLLMSVEEYLATSFPDGDREYLDGVVVERNLGTPDHSKLQKIFIAHLLAYETPLRLELFPECRTRITETRYRVPDVLVMVRPYRKTRRALLDPPFLIVEVLSPDDRVKDTVRRFRDYEAFGVRHIVQMDPEDRTTFVFTAGALLPKDLEGFDVPERGFLPFNSKELLARLDEEPA